MLQVLDHKHFWGLGHFQVKLLLKAPCAALTHSVCSATHHTGPQIVVGLCEKLALEKTRQNADGETEVE